MNRDPHLPPPEACDWLLSQEWSEPIPETNISYSPIGPGGCSGSFLLDHHHSFADIGSDGAARIYMHTDDMQILQEDAVARQADVYEASGLTPEQQLVVTINETIAAADVSAVAAVGALTMAAIAIASQACDLKMQPDEEAES